MCLFLPTPTHRLRVFPIQATENKYINILILYCDNSLFFPHFYTISFQLIMYPIATYLRSFFFTWRWWLSSDEWELSSFFNLFNVCLVIIFFGIFLFSNSDVGNIIECLFFFVDIIASYSWGVILNDVKLFLDGVSELLLLLELELLPLRLFSSSATDFPRIRLEERILDFLGVTKFVFDFFDDATVSVVLERSPRST